MAGGGKSSGDKTGARHHVLADLLWHKLVTETEKAFLLISTTYFINPEMRQTLKDCHEVTTMHVQQHLEVLCLLCSPQDCHGVQVDHRYTKSFGQGHWKVKNKKWLMKRKQHTCTQTTYTFSLSLTPHPPLVNEEKTTHMHTDYIHILSLTHTPPPTPQWKKWLMKRKQHTCTQTTYTFSLSLTPHPPPPNGKNG